MGMRTAGSPAGSGPGTAPDSPAPSEAGGENPLAALSSLDPRLLQMGMRLWQEYQGGDERTTDLLQALRPFLRKERQARLGPGGAAGQTVPCDPGGPSRSWGEKGEDRHV